MKPKKEEILSSDEWDFMSETIPEKLSTEEKIALTSFSLALLITLHYLIAVSFMVLITAGYFILKKITKKYDKSPKKFFKKISNLSKVFLIFFFIFFIIDEFLTWIAVWKLKIAIELNPFSVWLWNSCGYFLGEVIRFNILAFIFILMWVFANSKDNKKILISFGFSIVGFFFWLYAIISNLWVLFNFGV
jgi:hypothetical protein